jgi:phosphohistidine phosphatase
MARQLWLLRHADAEPHGTRADAERRLTSRGERQARLAGLALGRLHVSVDAVLVSPKVRAQQTAQLALEAWGEEGVLPAAPPGGEGEEPGGVLQTHLPLAEGFDAAQALDALSAVGPEGHLMVVGHEPDLSGVVGELAGARVDLKKGGLAVVRLEGGAANRRSAGRSGDSRQGRVSLDFGQAPRYARSGGGGGELVILLRPRELALIADRATADV